MKKLCFALFMVIAIVGHAQFVNTATLSVSTAQTCDSVTVTIAGTHPCTNTVIDSIRTSVVGTDINVVVYPSGGICLPITTNYSTTFTFSAGIASPGAYTVKTSYFGTLGSVNNSLSVTPCCPHLPDAGEDTLLCNMTSYGLSAAIPPSFVTGNWTVASGTGSISSPSQPNTTVTGMSLGLNEIVWTTTDTVCTLSDTLIIDNLTPPSDPMTANDTAICGNSLNVKANKPSSGLGRWSSTTSGASIFDPDSAETFVALLKPGINEMIWEVYNEACPSKYDTLFVNYAIDSIAPVITLNNVTLTSTPADHYQWFKNDTILTNDTNQQYVVQVDGTYKVRTNNSICPDWKLFSNEIFVEVPIVGMENSIQSTELEIFPNPVQDVLFIKGMKVNQVIEIRNNQNQLMKTIHYDNSIKTVDISDLSDGLYFIIERNPQDYTQVHKLVVRH